MRDRFNAVDKAIDDNSIIAESILNSAFRTFGLDAAGNIAGDEVWRSTCCSDDVGKASTTINQFYRDWSVEGAAERMAHFVPVLKDLERLFGKTKNRNGIKILVPGAGLGRLVFEICNAGYNVEGNEISYHALMASNWVLNNLAPKEKYSLHPFALKFSNHKKLEDQLLSVQIPDIHPGRELRREANDKKHPPGTMSMSASDFLTTYRQEEQHEEYNAVATVFFIDTGPNIIRYIEAISHTLKKGGYWINLGPLLWHFEERTTEPVSQKSSNIQDISGIEEPGSVELNEEDIINLVQMMGFKIEVLGTDTEPMAGYIQQQTSMSQNTYRVLHFVAKKVYP